MFRVRNLLGPAITAIGAMILVMIWLGGFASAKGISKDKEQATSCGMQWRVVTSVNYNAYDHILEDVVAISPSDAWAVGNYKDADDIKQTLIEHWNGNEWSLVPSPNIRVNGFAVDNQLAAVAAISANNVWAVGSYDSGVTDGHLIIHWNGSIWSTSTFGDELLRAITVVADNDIWAVGNQHVDTGFKTFIRHWNGTQWSTVSSPNVGTGSNYLFDITTGLNGELWAVGTYQTSGGILASLVLKYSQNVWTADTSTPVPGPGNRRLYAVDVAPGGAVWAVGNFETDQGTKQTFVLRRLNGSWSIISSPNVNNLDNELFDIVVLSDNIIWAVGYNNAQNNNQVKQALALYWNGTTWTSVPPVWPSLFVNELRGVTPIGDGQMWTVGYSRDGAGHFRTLTEKWSDPCVCNIAFSDLPAGSTFYPYVQCLACQSIITGYDDGTFRPNASITRGQLSKIVSNALGLSNPPGAQLFEDVVPGSTFYDFVQRLAQLNVISGYPCGGPGEPCSPNAYAYFRPGANASRGQISKIVSNAAGYSEPQNGQTFEDVATGSTYHLFVERLASREVMAGYPCGGPGEPCSGANRPYFRPSSNATRGQVSKIVSNTFFPECADARK